MLRILSVALALLLFSLPAAAQVTAEESLDRLGDEILENFQSFYPVLATNKGIHKYDYRFTDYSPASVGAEVAKLKKFQSRLLQYKPDLMAVEARIKWKLLKSNVDIALHNLEMIKWYQRSPYIYIDDAINGIYLILSSPYAALDVRALNIIARLKALPDLLAQAKKNLRRPAPVYLRLTEEYIVTGISFFRTMAEELRTELPPLAAEIDGATERAIAAMEDFQNFLQKVTPGAEGAFAIGKEAFNYKLKNEYFLDYDVDSLLRIGETLFREADSAYHAYEGWLDSNRAEVDSPFVLTCLTKQDLLDYYNWEIEQTRLYLIQKDIVTVPEDIAECIAVETPQFLRNVISSIAYQPAGTFNTNQTGYFYVRPISDSLEDAQKEAYFRFINRRGFKGSVVHEAFPGHHLQFYMASLVDDDVRKWQDNILYSEGWTLYCEEMMYESGFYGNDKRRYLNILGGIRFRAARIIADVKLHTGQFSIDSAVAWMTDVLGSDSSFIRIEVNRYAMQPTVPMSYLIGKGEVMRLRDDLKAREGENFRLKDFHDRYLSVGMITPKLIRELWGL